MYEILKSKLKEHTTTAQKYNYLREYLQLLILKILDERGYCICGRNSFTH